MERTRPKFFAPKFCPMMGPTDADSAKITPNAIGVRRLTIAQPATASSPNCAIDLVTKAFANGVAIWVNTAGMPMAKNGLNSRRMVSWFGGFKRPCILFKLRQPTHTITQRARIIAIAAPRISSFKPKINTGSSTISDNAGNRVTHILRLASPTALSNPLKQMPKPSNGTDGRTICIKTVASSAAIPVAPSKRVRSPTNGNISVANRVEAPNTITSEVEAVCCAAVRSPRPKACAVKVLAATDKPIHSDKVKNKIVLE